MEFFITFYVLQIITIYNVVKLGWDVKKIGENTFELSKKNNNIHFDLENFIDEITTIKNIKT